MFYFSPSETKMRQMRKNKTEHQKRLDALPQDWMIRVWYAIYKIDKTFMPEHVKEVVSFYYEDERVWNAIEEIEKINPKDLFPVLPQKANQLIDGYLAEMGYQFSSSYIRGVITGHRSNEFIAMALYKAVEHQKELLSNQNSKS